MSKPRVTVLKYGLGNLGSMVNMLMRAGAQVEIAENATDVRSAERLILPGVGAFDAGVMALQTSGVHDVICERAGAGLPILGVCLGMQLLGRASEEGNLGGLGLLDAACVKFDFSGDTELQVPHMGWSTIHARHPSELLDGLLEQSRFYFVHSYHLVCKNKEDVLASSVYGREFNAVVGRENIMGVQFHPEKSHRFGLALLQNFLKL